jgi:hypothetical protein
LYKVINTGLGWTIVADEYLEKKLKEIRIGKLPVETGGVLIGSYDMSRKIVYIVDTIPHLLIVMNVLNPISEGAMD